MDRPPDTSMRPAPVRSLVGWTVAAATFVALATGLAQVTVVAWRLTVARRIVFQSREFVWMTPLGYVLVFAALLLPVCAVAVLSRPFDVASGGRRASAVLLLFVGGFALALLAPWMHPAAQGLLALGAAVRLAPALARLRTARLAALAAGLAVFAGVVGGVAHATRAAAEERARAALPAAPAGAPNVLLVVLDTVRASSLGLLGRARDTTPRLEGWAAEGVSFDHAFTPSSWTYPAHASLFTGRLPSAIATSWQTTLAFKGPLLADVLRARGYDTGAFVANMYYVGHDSGLDAGFIRFRDYRTTLAQVLRSTTLMQTRFGWWLYLSRHPRDVGSAVLNFDVRMPAIWSADRKAGHEVTREFLDWQAGVEGRPFFAFLNYFDGHEPHDPPRRYRTFFSPRPTELDLYEGSIRYLDDELDRLFRALRARGVLDRTIVVVTSDHGQQFGEHGLTGHGNSLYSQLVWVPLVVRYPPLVPANVRVTRAVSLQDVAATVLELAGAPAPGIGGVSFAEAWSHREVHEAPHPPIVLETTDEADPSRRGVFTRAVVADGLHWVRWFDRPEELYAYREDREERHDLAGAPDLRVRREALARIVAARSN